MTASTVQFAAVSDTTAQPATIQGRGLAGCPAKVIKVTGLVATTSTDDIGDIVLLTPIPWNAKIHSIRLFNAAMDTNGSPLLTVDVGVYTIDRNGTVAEAVASTSRVAYATDSTALRAASTTGTEVAFITRGIDKINNTVLDDAGLTAVPIGKQAVLALYVTAVAATGVSSAKLTVMVAYTM